MGASKNFKKIKANKNFNFIILQKDFFNLNELKHFDAYSIAIYFYLINKLNENFYNNPVEISINNISKNLKINYKTVLSRIEILKENNLIFWENSGNNTYFYFGELAKEKIKQEIKNVKRPEKVGNETDFFKRNLSHETYQIFKNYTVETTVTVNEKEKFITFETENSFIKNSLKTKLFPVLQQEIKDYIIK